MSIEEEKKLEYIDPFSNDKKFPMVKTYNKMRDKGS